MYLWQQRAAIRGRIKVLLEYEVASVGDILVESSEDERGLLEEHLQILLGNQQKLQQCPTVVVYLYLFIQRRGVLSDLASNETIIPMVSHYAACRAKCDTFSS